MARAKHSRETFRIDLVISEDGLDLKILQPTNFSMNMEIAIALMDFTTAIAQGNFLLEQQAIAVGGLKVDIPENAIISVVELLEDALNRFADVAKRHGFGKRSGTKFVSGYKLWNSDQSAFFCLRGGLLIGPDG